MKTIINSNGSKWAGEEPDQFKNPPNNARSGSATMTAVLAIEKNIEKNANELERILGDKNMLLLKEINDLSFEVLKLFGELQCDIFSIPEPDKREEHLKKSYSIANSLLSKIERRLEAEQLIDLLNMNMTKQFRELWEHFQKYCEGIELKYSWAQNKVA